MTCRKGWRAILPQGITLGNQEKAVLSQFDKKARNKGITLGIPEKTASIQVEKKVTEKVKKRPGPVKIVEQASLQDRIKLRKACWK